MKEYPAENIRNVALISHSGAGKTTIGDAMLFISGGNDRFGKVDEETSVLDFDPEEIKRKTTISTSVAPIEWRGRKINILDTPGYFDFVGEVRSALRVSDGAIVVVDATGGVEVGTELVWQYASEYQLPRLFVINKLDRENTDFQRVVDEINDAFGGKAVPLYLPIGKESGFKGLVDIVRGIALTTGADGKVTQVAVPPELEGAVKELKERLKEAACDGDDALLEKYLEEGDLTDEEILKGLRGASIAGKVFLVVPVSAQRLIGIAQVLDAVSDYLPSPKDVPAARGKVPGQDTEVTREADEAAPFSALVFKTTADPYVGKLTLFRVYSGKFLSNSICLNSTRGRTERVGQLYIVKGKNQEPVAAVGAGDIGAVAKLQETLTGDTLCKQDDPVVFPAIKFPAPVYSVAVHPKTKGDEDKISAGLTRLTEEDPTIRVERNAETGETILSGLGEVHVDVTTGKLKRKFGVDVDLTTPKIPYRETIKGSAKAEGKHKKQTGGRGQYGHVFIEFEPLPGQEFEFVDKIFGGAVPRQYIPAVEKGLREAMQEGVLAGYPVTNIRATLYDGSFHPVDSSEMAFKIAASLAFKKGCMEAQPVILEPIVRVEVTVPEQFMGDIMGDLNKKRGRILGMESKGHIQVIKAMVPLAEMQKYAIDLRSMTQGRGLFTMEFDHYEEVPPNIAEAIIEEAKKAKEQK
ncbi:MAG: elongation factor G [Candidatus Fermentithermobacillus carboniphilus]|uniref:Elongation factor G n=1 Tax=Candidatus Fermentithermobacillus carboniphilus TaxID=3085328 RepID=A0AAT9LB63_9FIRM|nr:MAG: elongation factor G [Candidatus Fermentithermobacillus carboniphilus]